MKKLLEKVFGIVKGFIQHWNKPGEGNHIPSKELVAYSVGGMGVQFIAAIAAQIIMSSSCLLIGSVYGMKPTALATILLINTIFTIVIQPLKGWLIDNTNTKAGKVRPYILWLAFPTAFLMILMAYLPFQTMSNMQMTIVVGVIYTLMQFVYGFYLGMYNLLPQLMTPNTDERAVVYSVSSIVYSMAPTITGFLFPLLANVFPKGLFDQNFYKTLFPIFAIIGAVLSLWVYFGTKERIVVPKAYKAKVGFFEGFKLIGKYRYFWILNGATVVVFARGAVTAIITWVYTYMLQNNVIYSILTLIVGTASFVGMVLGPILSKTIGKRNANILTDIIFSIASVVVIFFANNIAVLIICIYVMFWAVAVQIITLPAMNGDALDFLQLKTGERLEGFTGNFAILTSLIAIGTNYVIPYINEYYGLIDNYDVLYDPAIRSPMIIALAVLSAVGGIAHAAFFIPWDLTEKKHAEVIEQLKMRAQLENEKNGDIGASIITSEEVEVSDVDLAQEEV